MLRVMQCVDNGKNSNITPRVMQWFMQCVDFTPGKDIQPMVPKYIFVWGCDGYNVKEENVFKWS